MKKGLLTIAVCCCCAIVMGQNSISIDTLKNRYEQMTLHFINGYISKGNSRDRISGASLQNEFRMSADAFKAYQEYKRKRTTAIVLGAFSLAGFTASIFMHSSNRDLSRVFFYTGIVSYTISMPFFIQSHKKIQYAVWVRNRDVLIK